MAQPSACGGGLLTVRSVRAGPVPAQSNAFLAWIEVSELKLDKPLAFFEKAGVGLSPGREFGDDRFMRLNFGCPRSLVEEAVTRIRLAVSDYRAS